MEFADFLERELSHFGIRLCRVEIVGKTCLHLISGSSLVSDYEVALHRPSFTEAGIRSLARAGLTIIETDPSELNGANFFEANGRLIGDAVNCPKSCEIISRKFEMKSVAYDQSAIKNGSFTCDTIKVPPRA
jgi:N-dimethylarginine dimethylaminohydrolase